MKVLLVGNYEFDGSMSIKIFASVMHRELLQAGIDVQMIAPTAVFGRIKPATHGFGKWLGYIDRFLIFPHNLRVAAATADVVHMCDRGSAMYATNVENKPVVVTCHDMLAVRQALGEMTDCRVSKLGRFLQSWTVRGMRRAARVVCISQATFEDARRILGSDRNLCVILDGLNYPFQPLPGAEVDRRLGTLTGIKQQPFILHVGSNEPRKNREGVLRAFACAAQGTNLQMVFAGAALNRDLLRLARELQVENRVAQVVRPKVEIIEALYNRAVALLFPSRYEGFGWPPIEAQACGCPVVGSNIPPLVEVLGGSADLRSLDDEAGMADAIRGLATNSEYREQLRQRGFENVRARFQTSRMIDDYVSVYRTLTSGDSDNHLSGSAQIR